MLLTEFYRPVKKVMLSEASHQLGMHEYHFYKYNGPEIKHLERLAKGSGFGAGPNQTVNTELDLNPGDIIGLHWPNNATRSHELRLIIVDSGHFDEHYFTRAAVSPGEGKVFDKVVGMSIPDDLRDLHTEAKNTQMKYAKLSKELAKDDPKLEVAKQIRDKAKAAEAEYVTQRAKYDKKVHDFLVKNSERDATIDPNVAKLMSDKDVNLSNGHYHEKTVVPAVDKDTGNPTTKEQTVTFNSKNKQNLNITSLAGSPTSVPGEFRITNNRLKTFAGGPEEIGGNFLTSGTTIKSLAGFPKEVRGNIMINEGSLKDFHNFHKHLEKAGGNTQLYIADIAKKENILGVLLVPGIKSLSKWTTVGKSDVAPTGNDKTVIDIINKYLPNTSGVSAINKCSLELDEAGFEALANI